MVGSTQPGVTAIGPLPPSQQWPLTPRFIFGHRGHGASPGLQGNRPGMEAHRQSTTKRRREQGGMKNVAAEVQGLPEPDPLFSSMPAEEPLLPSFGKSRATSAMPPGSSTPGTDERRGAKRSQD